MYITKQKFAEMAKTAPSGYTPVQLAEYLVKSGHTLEGYNEPKSNVVKDVARDIIRPFAQSAEGVSQGVGAFGSVLKAGGQLALGKKDEAKKTLDNRAAKITQSRQEPLTVLGKNVGYLENAKQGAGAGLEVLSTFVGGGGVGSALKTGFKSGVKLLAKEGAKTGFKSGSLYGAGSALRENKDVGTGILTGGTAGIVGGALLSPAIGVTQKLIPAITKKALGIAEKKLYDIAEDLTKRTPTTIKRESKWMKNTPQFLVEEKILPLLKSENRRIDASDALTALNAKSYSENKAFRQVLVDSGKTQSLNELRDRLQAELGEELKTSGTSLEKAMATIDQEIEAYKRNFLKEGIQDGDDLILPIEVFNDIKSGLWKKSSVSRRVPGSELEADVFYQMGHSAKELIEEKIDDASIGQMNSRLGDFAQAIKVLETANGKVVPGGMLGRGLTKLAGTIAGANGGVTGAILGNITAGKLADLAANPKIRTSVYSKVYDILKKSGKSDIIEQAQKILEKRANERATRKLLDAPKFIPLKSKSDTSKLFSQEEADALLRELGVIKDKVKKNIKPGLTIEDVSKKPLKSLEVEAKKYLYHTTPSENILNIKKEGLKSGGGQFGEGTYFTNSEKELSDFIRDFDSQIRIKRDVAEKIGKITENQTKYKDVKELLLSNTGKSIPPEAIELKLPNGEWKSIIDINTKDFISNINVYRAKELKGWWNKNYNNLSQSDNDFISKIFYSNGESGNPSNAKLQLKPSEKQRLDKITNSELLNNLVK